MAELKECKYRLPCGWCDRKNEKCELLQKSIVENSFKKELVVKSTANQHMCNHEWVLTNLAENTPFFIHYYCYKCGATKTVACE